MTQSPECPVCSKHGLAVFPGRYAVVPERSQAPTGDFTCPEVVEEPIPGYKYTARTLRAGFLYVFYEKNHLGANKWAVYSVSIEGKLHRQLSPGAASYTDKEEMCSRCGSGSFNKDFFVIEHPEKCGTTWLAFSEHKWSEATVERYQSDVDLRASRMQDIEPAAWLSGPKANSYTRILALPSNLECLAEYSGEGSNHAFVHPELSSENGDFIENVLKSRHSVFPWHMRNLTASGYSRPHASLLAQMQAASPNPHAVDDDLPHYFPMLVTLWDAVGIARELNGGLADLLGNAVRYENERQMQIDAANAFANMQKIFEAKAAFTVEQTVAGNASLANQRLEERTSYFIDNRLSPRERGIIEEHRPLYDRYRAGEIGWDSYVQQRSQIVERHVTTENMRWPASLWLSVEERRQVIEDNFRKNDAARRRNTTSTWAAMHEERLPEETRRSLDDWESDYAPLFDLDALNTFNANYERFQQAVAACAAERTEPLLTWLRAPLLLDTLEDYDPALVEDGVAFEEVVGSCMLGLACTEVGSAQVHQWIVQAQAGRENLIWRGVLLNQEQAIKDTEALLATSLVDTRTVTEATVAALVANIKNLQRVVDMFKKAHSVYDAIGDNARATASGSRHQAFGIHLRKSTALGLDKLVTTIGEGLYKALPAAARTADLVGEKTLHALFLLRAGVDKQDVENLIQKQAAAAALARNQTVLDLRRNMAGIPRANPLPQVEDLRKAWAEFKGSGTESSVRAIRDIRLAMVVGLMEGANLAKLMAQSEDDLRSRSLIAASMMGLTAVVADIASVGAKSVLPDANDAWTFQKLKLVGGTLASVGSFVGAVVAVGDLHKELNRQEWLMMGLYGSKAAISLLSAGATAGTTISYAAPLLERLTGRQSAAMTVRVIGTRTAAIVGARILMLSVGLWITVALIAVEVAIWSLSPTPLQHWSRRNAFGNLRLASSAYKTPAEQMEELDKAIGQMG